MWLEVPEPSGSGCRCAENLWRYRRHMKSKTRLRVLKWLNGEIARIRTTVIVHRPAAASTEVIWYYGRFVELTLSGQSRKMSRAVIERREVSASAERTPSQNKHSRWFLMGWHRHFFPHNSTDSSQSHNPGGRYDIAVNFPDLIQFSPKGKKKESSTFLAIYMMHLIFSTCWQRWIWSCAPGWLRSASA